MGISTFSLRSSRGSYFDFEAVDGELGFVKEGRAGGVLGDLASMTGSNTDFARESRDYSQH